MVGAEYMLIARGLLELYFAAMELAGKSEAEKDAMYQQEALRFKENKPEKLVGFPE